MKNKSIDYLNSSLWEVKNEGNKKQLHQIEVQRAEINLPLDQNYCESISQIVIDEIVMDIESFFENEYAIDGRTYAYIKNSEYEDFDVAEYDDGSVKYRLSYNSNVLIITEEAYDIKEDMYGPPKYKEIKARFTIDVYRKNLSGDSSYSKAELSSVDILDVQDIIDYEEY